MPRLSVDIPFDFADGREIMITAVELTHGNAWEGPEIWDWDYTGPELSREDEARVFAYLNDRHAARLENEG